MKTFLQKALKGKVHPEDFQDWVAVRLGKLRLRESKKNLAKITGLTKDEVRRVRRAILDDDSLAPLYEVLAVYANNAKLFQMSHEFWEKAHPGQSPSTGVQAPDPIGEPEGHVGDLVVANVSVNCEGRTDSDAGTAYLLVTLSETTQMGERRWIKPESIRTVQCSIPLHCSLESFAFRMSDLLADLKKVSQMSADEHRTWFDMGTDRDQGHFIGLDAEDDARHTAELRAQVTREHGND